MANPSFTQTLNTFVASTAQNRRPDLVDNWTNSATLFTMLAKKNKIKVKGGQFIQVPHTYAGFPSSSYGRNSSFDTSISDFATALVFNWKFAYAPCNLNEIDVELNDSPEQTFDLVEAAMENAELSLVDELATQLYGDGTGNGGLDLDGLAIAVSRSGTYGGLARGTDAQGASIRAAFENTSFGPFSLANLNTQYGTAAKGRMKPDLIVTDQTVWNYIWTASQPSERSTPGDEREIGFEYVRFNGAYVTVDSHQTAGYLHALNTNMFELFAHPKWDFRFRGFMSPTNQQTAIGQLIAWLCLVCRGPRYNGVLGGITA